MICTICKTRFAPFPKEDFDFVGEECTKEKPDYLGRVNGIYARSKKAIIKRSKIYHNNDPGTCSEHGCCA